MARRTKQQLIADGLKLGVPSDRLSGTKVEIEQAIASYEADLLQASADTAVALNPEVDIDVMSDLDGIVQEYSETRPRDTAAGPFMRALAIGAAIFS